MAERYDFYVHDNRKITFNLTEPIMREDSGVTDFVFHIPKILNELEVSDWSWWFVFVNAKKEKYSIALTLSDDPERPLEFNTATYTVDYAMSIKAGSVQFALEAINAGTGGAIDNEWHTLTYETKVKETLQGNQAEYEETESDIISELIQTVRTKMNQVIGGATPTPVASVSAMTDPSKLYLLTTDGNWYYHNGTQFVSGGVYGAGIVDAVPTQGSTNAVSSGGVWDEIEEIKDVTIITTTGESVSAGTNLDGGYWRYINNAWQYVSTSGTAYFHNVEFAVTGGTKYRIAGRHTKYCPLATFWNANDEIIGSTGDINPSQTSENVTMDVLLPDNCTKIIVTSFPLEQNPTVTELVAVNNLKDSLRITKMSGCEISERTGYPIEVSWSGKTATIVFPYQFYITGYDGIHKIINLSEDTTYQKTLSGSDGAIIYDVDANDVVFADRNTQTALGNKNIVVLGKVSNGIMFGPLSAKASVRINDIESTLNKIKYLDTTGIHIWDRAQKITAVKQGTSFVFTFPFQFYVSGQGSNWVKTITLNSDNTYTKTITVNTSQHIIYNPATNDVEVMSWADMATLAGTRDDYIFLGTNVNGRIFGALSPIVVGNIEEELDNAIHPLPYYYDEYMADKVTEIEEACAFTKGVAFPFITDVHLKVNPKQSGKLIKYLGEHTNAVPFVVSGGDIPYATDTEENVLADAQKWLEYMGQWGKEKTIQVHGNHDYMCNFEGGGTFRASVGELNYYIAQNTMMINRPEGALYGYYDVSYRGIRIIIMDDYDTGYSGNVWVDGREGYSQEQLTFVKNAILGTTGHVLVVSHQTSDATMSNYIVDQSLQTMLIAAKNHTGDFSAWSGDIIMHLSGHSHKDESHVENNLLSVATVCDAAYTSPSGYTRKWGTTSEQAFDVVCIDKENRTIKMVRIGAGSSRTFAY